MRYQGLALGGAERRAIAEWVTGRRLHESLSGDEGRCSRALPYTNPAAGRGWNGWSPAPDNSHFQSTEQAGLTAADVPRLKLKWAFGFPDAAASWGQATIAAGRVFIGSQNGTVYSLDARSGCVAWTFVAHSGVRSSITATRTLVYFGDQAGYVYAVDARTGRLEWSRRVDDHPLLRLTGSPVLYAGRLYVPTSSYEEGGKPPGYACCSFRGSLVALDAANGEVAWRAYTIPEPARLLRVQPDGTELRGPAGGAIWSAPTIDVKRKAVYVATGNTYSGAPQKTTDAIVAMDLATGATRWVRQMNPGERDVFGCVPGDVNCGEKPGPDFDFGASPVLVTVAPQKGVPRSNGSGRRGRDLIVAGQKSGIVYALDPDRQGAIVWRYRAGGGSGLGGVQWGVAADEAHAYAPIADLYADEPGGLHAIDLLTGKRAWLAPPPPPVCGRPSRACSGALFSAVTVIPGVVFSPSNDGAVRAHSTRDGTVLWSFDTNREFRTTNGVEAKGGSMSGPAPTIAAGTLYVASGYGMFGLRPGNVLLAFRAD